MQQRSQSLIPVGNDAHVQPSRVNFVQCFQCIGIQSPRLSVCEETEQLIETGFVALAKYEKNQFAPPVFARHRHRTVFQCLPRVVECTLGLIRRNYSTVSFGNGSVYLSYRRPRMNQRPADIEEYGANLSGFHCNTSSLSLTTGCPTWKPSRPNASPTRNSEPVTTMTSAPADVAAA